ncbi:MAG TPA: class D sortase [Pseudogracilibacillus sp.]|nr:class D sortase [Pseudogracilibacillus sp.]
MKKLSIFIMLIGVGIISFALFQMYDSKQKQSESYARAEALLDNKDAREAEKVKPFKASFGDEVGMLTIKKIDARIPIVEGTDEDELAHGVGHYAGTAFPEEDDQVVLSGHRDTVFRRMGELNVGDIITVEMPYGNYDYEIYETFIVDADDRSVIKSTAPDEVLTVTTCYPFNFVGSAPDRYIINAKPVYNKATK